MPFAQLIYSSRSRAALDRKGALSALRAILKSSQANNAKAEISGFLIFDGSSFVQILEGPRAAVWATYERIKADPRHAEVALVQTCEVLTRSFPEWSMGGALRTPDKQAIFLRHGIGGPIDRAKLMAPSILALAMDLQDHERAERARRLAS